MNCQSLCAVILLANAIQTNSNTDTDTGISYRIRTVDVYFAHAAQFKQFHSTIVFGALRFQSMSLPHFIYMCPSLPLT